MTAVAHAATAIDPARRAVGALREMVEASSRIATIADQPAMGMLGARRVGRQVARYQAGAQAVDAALRQIRGDAVPLPVRNALDAGRTAAAVVDRPWARRTGTIHFHGSGMASDPLVSATKRPQPAGDQPDFDPGWHRLARDTALARLWRRGSQDLLSADLSAASRKDFPGVQGLRAPLHAIGEAIQHTADNRDDWFEARATAARHDTAARLDHALTAIEPLIGEPLTEQHRVTRQIQTEARATHDAYVDDIRSSIPIDVTTGRPADDPVTEIARARQLIAQLPAINRTAIARGAEGDTRVADDLGALWQDAAPPAAHLADAQGLADAARRAVDEVTGAAAQLAASARTRNDSPRSTETLDAATAHLHGVNVQLRARIGQINQS